MTSFILSFSVLSIRLAFYGRRCFVESEAAFSGLERIKNQMESFEASKKRTIKSIQRIGRNFYGEY